MAPLLSSSRRSRKPGDTEATPTSAAAAASSSTRNRPQTPEYEPLATPLNPKAQRALASLYSAIQFRQLKEHIRQAGDKLTETAGEANERVADARHRFEKSTSRKRAASAAAKKLRKRERKNKTDGDAIGDDEKDHDEDEDEDDGNDDEEEDDEDEDDEKRRAEIQNLDNLEAKVKLTTSQLEERMRRVVDAEYKVGGLQVAIQEIAADAETAGTALNTSRRRARLRERGAAIDADWDEDMDEDEDEDEDDAAPTVVPSQLIKERLAGHESQWEQQSLTQRYTNNNNYVGFYRIVHDAKYPTGEVPPVPPASTWFNHLEPNRRGANSRQQFAAAASNNDIVTEDEEDADIEIERERISLKCPLTLVVFEDPVKSTKCIHSFERKAIEDMIRASSMTVPAGENDFQGGGGRNARARRVRAVPCPICSVPMSLNDLEPDLVLVRRVRRMRAAELREQEEAELGGVRRGRNGITIDSDDEDEDDDDNYSQEKRQQREEEVRIKREKSRLSSRAPTVVNEYADEDEDDEMGDIHKDDDDDEDADVDEEDEEDD
ncbi:hypothetical protein EYB25_000647 [Talaromyces marneffei]|uniref:E3 SUMO-protein ligase NSE2 n=1 Tax=Talaromyces marneffei PM1 TaxID=1077442 RepID=A0A093VIS4_TALMA|nr:hypothetical protein EYB25_000647 [Talaromyces marneffei]